MRFGQAGGELDQHEGGRGGFPRPRPQVHGLWRGGGRHGFRRDGAGGHAGAQGRDLRARL